MEPKLCDVTLDILTKKQYQTAVNIGLFFKFTLRNTDVVNLFVS